jgi:hypothetical protein
MSKEKTNQEKAGFRRFSYDENFEEQFALYPEQV